MTNKLLCRSPPGNWISRWGIVLGSTLLYVHELNVYFMSTMGSSSVTMKIASALLALLGVLGAFGLSVAGCVDMKEDNAIHEVASLVFFVCYDAYMVLFAVKSLFSPTDRCRRLGWALVCLTASIGTKLRFVQVEEWAEQHAPDCLKHCLQERSGPEWFAIYEWVNLATVLLFINLTVIFASLRGSGTKVGVAVLLKTA